MLFFKKLLLYDKPLFVLLGLFVLVQIVVNVLNKDVAPFYSFSMFAGPAESNRLKKVPVYTLVSKDGEPILNPFNDFHKLPFIYTVDYYDMLHLEKGRIKEIQNSSYKYNIIGIKTIDSSSVYAAQHHNLYPQWLQAVYKLTGNNNYVIKSIYDYTTTTPKLLKTDTILQL